MNTKNICRILVIDENQKMVGILTERDVFRAIDTASST
jgi:predicted transcriptional regulator